MRIYNIKHNLYPLLRLAVPMALTGVMQSFVFFCETLFLAHLGQEKLAAGALVSWLFGTLVVILFGTLGSINVLVAHKHGAKDHEGVSLVLRDGLLLGVLLSIPMFLLFWNMAPIFLLLGQPASIVVLANTYLHALAWGMFPTCMTVVLLEWIIGLGHARTMMVFTLMGMLLNIFSTYVLIFGKYGFPALGIAGAGWGMTASNGVIVLILAFYVLTHKYYKPYFQGIFNRKKPSFFWELIKIGFPMGMMYCVEVAFFFALTLVMGSISIQLLAATQIVVQYLGVVMSVIFAMAQAITVRMGYLLGANEVKSAKEAGWTGVAISAMLMLIVAVFYVGCPSLLIAADFNIHDPRNIAIVHDIEKFLVISAVFQVFEATRISLFGILRALKDTRFTLGTSILSFWCIALPLGCVFAFYCKFGGIGLWWGMVVGAVFSVLLLSWRVTVKINRYVGSS